MTPEAQNKAISDLTGLCPKCNYVEDLNAMHHAEERILGSEIEIDYRHWLEKIHGRKSDDYRFWRASAAERAQALLIAAHKWTDE